MLAPDDHVWHELLEVKPSILLPTVDITAAGLLTRFHSAKGKWNVTKPWRL